LRGREASQSDEERHSLLEENFDGFPIGRFFENFRKREEKMEILNLEFLRRENFVENIQV